MTTGFLHKYFLNNSGKRLHKCIHYFDIYERHFDRFRNKSPVILEIGVFGGGSLQMWKSYFGDGAKIIGLDINPDCKMHEEPGIEVWIGSQDDPSLIDAIFAAHPRIDVVIDDGSHMMHHMRTSFELIYPRVHTRGIYLVEDMQTCYWHEYGGGLGRSDTFMAFVKTKLDELNAANTRGELAVTDFARSTDCIAVYDAVTVFEKRQQGARQNFITAGM